MMGSGRFPLRGLLIGLWLAIVLGVVYVAPEVEMEIAGWPLGYWFATQGALLGFIAIVVAYAWLANRWDRRSGDSPAEPAFDLYNRSLHRRFAVYVVGVLLFLLTMGVVEHMGVSRPWIGGIFLVVTVVLYAAIGIRGRTTQEEEYYVAGRRIPAVYNGMATAADWMSAASFISLAGGLYLQGFSGSAGQAGGLAYILGWTGGFCLVALLVAPHLRQLNLYTVPDFFQVRYGGAWPRRIAAYAAVLCSFTYLVAQIFGVGLITARLTGVHFEIGIMLGLGGVLVCSFLGGMRAVTWTQVAQYVILVLAFLIPVSWLAYKQLGNPLAPWLYGQEIRAITAIEQQLTDSEQERSVIQEYARRAEDYQRKLQDVDSALAAERLRLKEKLRQLNEQVSDVELIVATRRELAQLPKDPAAARELWTRAMQDNLARAEPLGGVAPQARPFPGDPRGSSAEQEVHDTAQRNFLALIFCLMLGTAGLPHLLTRFYTTPSVAQTRTSVAWSLIFISILYLAAPALAVLVKFEVMTHLVGQRLDALPAWLLQWARVDPALVSIVDVNADHMLQFAELKMAPDVVMLAVPELGSLPYVISGLVAAGGLAAALSTADGLLLTIGNALSHDLYFKGRQNEGDQLAMVRRVILSKFALLLVALLAAYVAAQKPAGILHLVTASFSLAAAAFVPAMILGIFWSKTSRPGAVVGMVTGLGVTVYYMLANNSGVRQVLDLSGDGLWWGIQPISAGVFGVIVGVVATVLASLASPVGRKPAVNDESTII